MIKKYDNYIETGIEWLNEIPSHWERVRLRYLCDITTGNRDTVHREDEGKYPFFVRSKTIEKISSFSYDGEAILTAGDGDICKIWHHVNEKFDFHQRVYMLYNFKKLNGRFLYYYISENFYHDVFKLSAKNTVDSLRLPMFLNFPVLVPTIQEQTKIAHYLDYQTTIIDKLIQQKEKLIDLLKEKRQAVINEAVTKGLNPNAKMKDSGIEWLGEVPKHWDVTKLKFLAKLNPSKSEIENSITGDDVVSFLPMEKVEESWSYDKNSTAKYSEVSAGLTYFKEGDIIMAKITPCFENGKAAILDSLTHGFGFGSTEFHTIRPLKVDRRYLFYVTRSDYFMSNGESFMTGSAGQKRVPTSFVNDFFVPIPKPTEQIEIALYIENYIEKNNKISNELKLQIEKLKEYRQSIISEAVTGKIDVRDWQPNKQQVA